MKIFSMSRTGFGVMGLFFTLATAGMIAALAGDHVVADSPSTPDKIVKEARRIVADAKESHYQHTTHVDAAKSVYDVDCSGFLCVILKNVSPEHLLHIALPAHHTRPLALQFYEAFTTAADNPEIKWKLVPILRDARPGDVLVWRKAEQVEHQDTGHVMIIDEAPVEESKGVFRVKVLDSTATPHGSDTRAAEASGVGRGTMYFTGDEQGKPVGYHWKSLKGAERKIQIAIGRAD